MHIYLSNYVVSLMTRQLTEYLWDIVVVVKVISSTSFNPKDFESRDVIFAENSEQP